MTSTVTHETSNLRVIDLSGYSFSGKGAFFELLSEFNGYHYHSIEFEFELLRTPGGILDLEDALVTHWSPVRASEALRLFKKLISVFGGNRSLYSRLFSHGYHYDFYFNGFTKLSNKFLSDLVQSRWKSPWPFALNTKSILDVFFRKLMYRLGFTSCMEFVVYFSRLTQSEFDAIVMDYLENLFRSILKPTDTTLLLNNAFEPFYPYKSHRFFRHPKSILVDRDPRDIYLSAKRNGMVSKSNVGKAVVGNTVEDFISRFLMYRSHNENQNSDSVLNLRFEDLVLSYDRTLNLLYDFLGESPANHIYKAERFNPEKSKRNVRIYLHASNSELADIKKIEERLSQFCVI